jgi:hypothetical protein
MPELNTLSPKKWVADYSGAAPTLDASDGVLLGDFAFDSGTGYTWQVTDISEGSPVWGDVFSATSLVRGNIPAERLPSSGTWSTAGPLTLSPTALNVTAPTVFNSAAGDIDFTINKNVTGIAYKYDATSDYHLFNSDLRVDKAAVIRLNGVTDALPFIGFYLEADGKLFGGQNIDGPMIVGWAGAGIGSYQDHGESLLAWFRFNGITFNQSNKDVDFTINKNIAGIAYKYDATVDTHTFGSLAYFAAGSASLPGISFAGDDDTGIFSSGANNISIAAGGTSRISVGVGLTTLNQRTILYSNLSGATPAAFTTVGQFQGTTATISASLKNAPSINYDAGAATWSASPVSMASNHCGMNNNPGMTGAIAITGLAEFYAYTELTTNITGAGSIAITNAYGLYYRNVAALGSKVSITNAYGVYIEEPTRGGTSNYALYANGPCHVNGYRAATSSIDYVTLTIANTLDGANETGDVVGLDLYVGKENGSATGSAAGLRIEGFVSGSTPSVKGMEITDLFGYADIHGIHLQGLAQEGSSGTVYGIKIDDIAANILNPGSVTVYALHTGTDQVLFGGPSVNLTRSSQVQPVMSVKSISGAVLPDTSGVKGEFGLGSDGYLYFWKDTSEVVRFAPETDWDEESSSSSISSGV